MRELSAGMSFHVLSTKVLL